jgi:hypothetical protein
VCARSAPKLPARDPRAFGEARELRPDDLGLDLRPRGGNERRGKAAVGAGDDALAADELGETHDALGHQLGMLDDHGRVGDAAGDQNFVVRKLDLFP